MHLRQKGVTDDLALWLLDKAKGIEGPLGYNADLYTHETATAFRDRFVEVLDQLAACYRAREQQQVERREQRASDELALRRFVAGQAQAIR